MSEPWYQGGLRFECTGCGNCCTGPPGYVWVNAREIDALAGHLSISLEDFGRRYLRRIRHRYSLLERSNGDCIFFREGKGCTVYPVRPRQCRTFPFWPEHLRSASDWEELKRSCPGAGQGRIYPPEEIQILKKGQSDA